jgi:hypothetical protein
MNAAAARASHLQFLSCDRAQGFGIGFDPAINDMTGSWTNKFEALHCHLPRIMWVVQRGSSARLVLGRQRSILAQDPLLQGEMDRRSMKTTNQHKARPQAQLRTWLR